jgi:ABC-type enterochelin transport system substrate-binding protein
MTARTFIVTLFALMLFSCNNNRTQDNARQETPKALEDNNLSYEIITKQGYEDLIESLYSELVSRDIDLKKLEVQIEELNKSKADSTNLFDKYNGKNQSYFTSANSHISK